MHAVAKTLARLQEHGFEAKDLAPETDGDPADPMLRLEIDGDARPLASLTEVLPGVLEAGRKGLDIQRYKGLGEMTAKQLWETTMDPERRTLLRVRPEDEVEADQMFTILMGENVQVRREFIEKHALEIANLDV